MDADSEFIFLGELYDKHTGARVPNDRPTGEVVLTGGCNHLPTFDWI